MLNFMILCLYGWVSAIAAAPSYQHVAQMDERQPHTQYGNFPTINADISNDLFTTHAGNVEENSHIAALRAQASYLPPAPFAVSTLQQQHLYQQPTNNKPSAIISKRFYLHTAPEDDDDDDETSVKQHYLTVGKARKNYNIVFIKSPVKAKTRTSLKITPAINEEKTVIYVLNKKHEAAEIDAQIYEPSTTTSKPEVYFIKYKTADEAAHAQHTIQAKYDALGGSTEVVNEGVGLEGSVIGSLDAARHSADNHDEAQPLATVYAEDGEFSQNTVDKQGVDVHLQHSSDASSKYLPPIMYERR